MGNWMEKMQKEVKPAATATEENKVDSETQTQTQETTQPAQETEVVAEVKTEVAEEKPSGKEVVSTSVFDFEFQTAEKKEETGMKTPEQFFEEVKKRYAGKDPFGLFGELEVLEEKETQINELQAEKNSYQEMLSVLPPDVIQVMKDALENKDYRHTMKTFAGSTLDYNKSVNSYGKEELIRLYNPELTAEDIEDMEEKALSLNYKLAKENYTLQQREYLKGHEDFVRQQNARAHEILNSVRESIGGLTTKMPNIKRTETKSVEDVMRNGAHSLFYDETGRYKKDAAEKVMFGTHGLKVIDEMKQSFEQILKRERALAKSEATEKVVTEVTADKIDRGSHAPVKVTLEESVSKSMPFLTKK